MDLFKEAAAREMLKNAPLATRMRPRVFDEFVGQEGLLGQGKPLRRAIEEDRVGSVILWGPPGCGKTALAQLIARMTRSHFETLNAVTVGVAEIRRVVAGAEDRRAYHGIRTLVFVDEIHRWAKNVQDALLPYVESGLITLIGATVENPMFVVNPALRSRSRLFRLEPLAEDDIMLLLRAALEDKERGLGAMTPQADENALAYLARLADGDARRALNALEYAVLSAGKGEEGIRHLSLDLARQAVPERVGLYDRDGDQHYDIVSAWIKSMRGSDPDAALYWLARMLYAGEDPAFLSRRMMILAAEDVGLADPQALVIASAAAQAVERLGMPEGRIVLAEAALYLALSPKSNSVIKGIDAALEEVRSKRSGLVPVHLRDASYRGARELGHGQGYVYPHDYPGANVEQQYLPEALAGTAFYQPTGEENIGMRLKNARHNKSCSGDISKKTE